MLSLAIVHARLNELLNGSLPLDEFEDWLVGASWNMHQLADSDVQAL